MTEPHDPARHDDTPMDPDTLGELRARLAVEPTDATLRQRHLAAAMDAYDTARPVAPPASLDAARRRRGRVLPWAAAAAAVLLVVAVGAQIAVRESSQQDSAGTAVSDATAPESVAAARDASDAGADRSDEEAAELAPPSAADGAAVDEADVDAAAGFTLEIGAFHDDDALRDAVADASAAERSRAFDDTASASTPPTTVAAPAPRDQAGSEASVSVPDAARAAPTCPEQVATLPVPRFAATVAGRPVIAALDGSALVVVALDDCTIRRP